MQKSFALFVFLIVIVTLIFPDLNRNEIDLVIT